MDAQDDPKALARRRFQTADRCLTVSQVLERYATDLPEVNRSLVDAVAPPGAGRATIGELGFGIGWLLEEMGRAYPQHRLVGLDLSRAMAGHVLSLPALRVDVTVGDMEALPFADGAFDVVVTCWTLYFMRDIDAALAAMGRCLRPGGRAVVATVAPDHMREYDTLADEAERLALRRQSTPDITERFNLETGLPYMQRHFGDVRVVDWRGHLALPSVDLLLTFWDSYRSLHLGDRAGTVRAAFERLAADRLRRDGEIRISRHGGAFIATKGAGAPRRGEAAASREGERA